MRGMSDTKLIVLISSLCLIAVMGGAAFVFRPPAATTLQPAPMAATMPTATPQTSPTIVAKRSVATEINPPEIKGEPTFRGVAISKWMQLSKDADYHTKSEAFGALSSLRFQSKDAENLLVYEFTRRSGAMKMDFGMSYLWPDREEEVVDAAVEYLSSSTGQAFLDYGSDVTALLQMAGPESLKKIDLALDSAKVKAEAGNFTLELARVRWWKGKIAGKEVYREDPGLSGTIKF